MTFEFALWTAVSCIPVFLVLPVLLNFDRIREGIYSCIGLCVLILFAAALYELMGLHHWITIISKNWQAVICVFISVAISTLTGKILEELSDLLSELIEQLLIITVFKDRKP